VSTDKNQRSEKRAGRLCKRAKKRRNNRAATVKKKNKEKNA